MQHVRAGCLSTHACESAMTGPESVAWQDSSERDPLNLSQVGRVRQGLDHPATRGRSVGERLTAHGGNIW